MASILFIGGTGQISLACVHEALRMGHDVSIFNRGRTAPNLPTGVRLIQGDFNDDSDYSHLSSLKFDAVCNFLIMTPAQISRDIRLFSGRTGQYIFISTASAYQKPLTHHVITEETPLGNPFWEYSRLKIECENILRQQDKLPYTIVRPSHTLRTRLPTNFSETTLTCRRMLAGKPVVVAGDGNSLWTITRSEDFARPFVRLFGNPAARNEYFHITSDTAFTWNAIYQAIGRGLGVEPEIVHVPTDTLLRFNSAWRGSLLGDKGYSVLFDNTKIRSAVGDFPCLSDLDAFLREPLTHFRTHRESLLPGEAELDALFDRIAQAQLGVGA